MAIGKNAIKRVANNGYSNVKSAAPDMENSEVSVDKTAVSEKKTVKKATPKAAAPKKVTAPKAIAPKKTAPKKSMESEPSLSPVKTAEKVVKGSGKRTVKSAKSFFAVGDELPIYLL